jgi:hypothetical protein
MHYKGPIYSYLLRCEMIGVGSLARTLTDYDAPRVVVPNTLYMHVCDKKYVRMGYTYGTRSLLAAVSDIIRHSASFMHAYPCGLVARCPAAAIISCSDQINEQRVAHCVALSRANHRPDLKLTEIAHLGACN